MPLLDSQRDLFEIPVLLQKQNSVLLHKPHVLNHGIMTSNQVASVILKYCGFSLLLFSRSVLKYQNLLPALPHFQLYCSNFAVPVKTFALRSFELPKVKLETLCWYQSPLQFVTSEMRFVLLEGWKNLCAHNFHPLQKQNFWNLQTHHPALL